MSVNKIKLSWLKLSSKGGVIKKFSTELRHYREKEITDWENL